MAVWKYFKSMGEHNPVCTDAGEILSFTRDTSNFSGSITLNTNDGEFYAGGEKFGLPPVLGCCFFSFAYPEFPDRQELPRDLPDGTVVEWPKNVRWKNCSDTYCTDFRVLYIVNRGNFLASHEGTETQWERYYKDIPTESKALNWLEQFGFDFSDLEFGFPIDIEHSEWTIKRYAAFCDRWWDDKEWIKQVMETF